MSHCCHPNASISARVVGKNKAGFEPALFASSRGMSGAAGCIAAIRSDCSPYIHRKIDLRFIPLDQQRNVMTGARNFALQIRNRRDTCTVDAQHDIALLQTCGERRTGDVLDDQTALGVQLLLLIGLQGPHRQAEFPRRRLRRRLLRLQPANPPTAQSSLELRSPCARARCPSSLPYPAAVAKSLPVNRRNDRYCDR